MAATLIMMLSCPSSASVARLACLLILAFPSSYLVMAYSYSMVMVDSLVNANLQCCRCLT